MKQIIGSLDHCMLQGAAPCARAMVELHILFTSMRRGRVVYDTFLSHIPLITHVSFSLRSHTLVFFLPARSTPSHPSQSRSTLLGRCVAVATCSVTIAHADRLPPLASVTPIGSSVHLAPASNPNLPRLPSYTFDIGLGEQHNLNCLQQRGT